ncbi:hypothetical protein U2W12_15005 [Methylomicrobium sp. Wu6]|nr:hypothetical protein [Methylomicrobium sp. Wu6]
MRSNIAFFSLPALNGYEYFCYFKAAIDKSLDKVDSTFSEQVKTLLNPKFQLFEKSANLTA